MGIHGHGSRKLGLRPHSPGRNGISLAWAKGQVPIHPPKSDHLTGWVFGMDGNDQFGVCGPTSVDNHRRMTTKLLTPLEEDATLEQVFDLYRRSGNPSFDPATGADDNGVEMAAMADAVNKGGIAGVQTMAFARLQDTSDASIAAAIHVFGGVLLAVTLESAQQSQTDAGTWAYQRSPLWGGHAIVCGAYDETTGFMDVVTWAQRVKTTAGFRQHQLDEVWLPIWPELVSSGRFFDSGVDTARFSNDFKILTGQKFPVAPLDAGRIIIDMNTHNIVVPADWTTSTR